MLWNLGLVAVIWAVCPFHGKEQSRSSFVVAPYVVRALRMSSSRFKPALPQDGNGEVLV